MVDRRAALTLDLIHLMETDEGALQAGMSVFVQCLLASYALTLWLWSHEAAKKRREAHTNSCELSVFMASSRSIRPDWSAHASDTGPNTL